MKEPFLADDLFLIALDGATGRHRLAPRLLSLGLAGGLLMELLMDQAIRLVDGRVWVDDGKPSSGVTHLIRDRIEAERHELRTWVLYVAQTATEDVAERLCIAGWIRKSVQGGRFRKATVLYDPMSNTIAPDIAWRALRLSNLLGAGMRSKPEIKTWPDAFLTVLCHAIGLTPDLLREGGPESWEYVDFLHTTVAKHHPAVHQLAICLGELVGTATFTHI